MAKKKTEKVQSTTNPWMVFTIILGVLLVLSLVWNIVFTMLVLTGEVGTPGTTTGNQAAPSQAQPSQPAAPSGEPVEVSLDDDPVMGDADAPVTLVEFSDYECPFCGRFYSQTLPQIKSEYIDTGKAKLVYRDFPLDQELPDGRIMHPRANPAAIAAECVQEQSGDEAYFEMHDLLFENQRALDDASLRSYASQVGVDLDEWDECYADEDGEMLAEVQADKTAGLNAGVSGTPTVFVNGQRIVGAQPYNVFKAAIDAALAE